jgi:seryl-tRNA synthetase
MFTKTLFVFFLLVGNSYAGNNQATSRPVNPLEEARKSVEDLRNSLNTIKDLIGTKLPTEDELDNKGASPIETLRIDLKNLRKQSDRLRDAAEAISIAHPFEVSREIPKNAPNMVAIKMEIENLSEEVNQISWMMDHLQKDEPQQSFKRNGTARNMGNYINFAGGSIKQTLDGDVERGASHHRVAEILQKEHWIFLNDKDGDIWERQEGKQRKKLRVRYSSKGRVISCHFVD